ncbi:hypothetical protein F5Y13DRAFT_191751 [Hypoxylon sp. FL1857]|nr:hypothetical protein F5Y13DRAFT_191751 [Hypoxylon sp. FL1857]
MINSDTWNSLTPAEQEAYLDGPSIPPPTGVQPDFDNPPNRNGLVIGVTTTCLLLATTFFFIRVYSRIFIEKRARLPDVLILLSFGAYIGVVWTIFRALSLGGFFVHQWNITAREFELVAFTFFMLPEFYTFMILFSKTAILLEWMQVFVPKGTRNLFFWTSLLVLILNAVFYIAGLFVLNLSCTPIEKFWKPTVPGTCLSLDNLLSFQMSSSCINLAFDLIILILPQPTIWTLNMSPRRKIGISLVFCMGILACLCALIRVIFVRNLFGSIDRTYTTAGSSLCVLAEMTCVLLVFCISAAPKVFAQSVLINQVAQLLRSWSRSNFQNSSLGSKQSGQDRTGRNGKYRVLDEFQIPLSDINIVATAPSAAGGVGHNKGGSSTESILYAPALITQNDRASDVSSDRQV